MNDLEKRSFYSFLTLYIGSSFLFLALVGFWYYTAQKNALKNSTYYRMQHYSDKISAAVINAHMHGGGLHLPAPPPDTDFALVSSQGKVVYGKLPEGITAIKNGFLELSESTVLISDTPQKHLNISFVIVESTTYPKELEALLAYVLLVMISISVGIVFVAWVLSKFFMRPIHQKVEQIEQFIQDISHELNTPVTALQMSTKRALQKGVYDEKILTNIAISTKQLYSIYRSLAYLNFSTPQQEPTELNLRPILEESIAFYSELSHAKNVIFRTDIGDAHLRISNERAGLLFSNLIGNAIKYSMPNSTVTVTLKEHFFSIEDEGVGIPREKLKTIFKPYERSSRIAGGFGIGLSIVRKICDEYDIRVDVESTLDKGSCFTLRW